MTFLWVAGGGIAGALLRYQISKWMNERIVSPFPYSTLFINVIGTFILGWLTRSAGVWFPTLAIQLSLLLGTGFCGAFTTFSTFSYEFILLVRDGRIRTAAAYVGATAVLGFAAAALGLYGLPGWLYG